MWKNAQIVGPNRERLESTKPKGSAEFLMSRTELMKFAKCPAIWIAPEEKDKDGEEIDDATKEMNFGSLVDCLATGPDAMDKRFAIPPPTYISSKGEEKDWTFRADSCKQWKEDQEADGKIVVPRKVYERAQVAVLQIMANDHASALMRSSQKQVLITAEWRDKSTGLVVPFAGLIDFVPAAADESWGKSLGDLKTARNGDPVKWARHCDDMGYDVQAAIYMDIYRAAKPDEDRVDFVHLVQENIHPFHVVSPMPSMSVEFLAWGRSKYERALRLYCDCLQRGEWPSYAPAGLAFGPTQIIGPDDLWAYRQCAGNFDVRISPKTEAKQAEEDRPDLVP